MTVTLPVGPEVLGVRLGADADVTDGWAVRELTASEGLDGPTGILQGGFAATLGVAAARLADTFGAPLTRVSARLHAPTPLGRPLELALRPGDGAAHHEVELRDGAAVLVTSTVELAGVELTPRVGDLVALAEVATPPAEQQDTYPRCWGCGQSPTHPAAQRMRIGYHGTDTVVPWLAEDDLAVDGQPGTIDPFVVAAMLDCPGGWAAMPSLRRAGFAGCLLVGYELRVYRDAPTYEPLRLVARHDGTDGRKVRVRSALVDESGVVYAVASALHIAVAEVPDATR